MNQAWIALRLLVVAIVVTLTTAFIGPNQISKQHSIGSLYANEPLKGLGTLLNNKVKFLERLAPVIAYYTVYVLYYTIIDPSTTL